MTRQDLILATIRTAIPGIVGIALAWLIARIPAVADVVAGIDAVLATSAPGYTVIGLLNLLAIGLVIAAYYWVARMLGKRWPIVERFLLGSAKTPGTYSMSRDVDGTFRLP